MWLLWYLIENSFFGMNSWRTFFDKKIQGVGTIMISLSYWLGIWFWFMVAINIWPSHDKLLQGDSHHCPLYGVPSVCCRLHYKPSATRGQAADVRCQWNLTSVNLQVSLEGQGNGHSAFIVFYIYSDETPVCFSIIFCFLWQ